MFQSYKYMDSNIADERPPLVRIRRSYKYLLFLIFLILFTTATTIIATVSPKHVKSPANITLSSFLFLILLSDLLVRYKTEQSFFSLPSNTFDVALLGIMIVLLISSVIIRNTQVDGLQGCYIMALCVVVTR